MFNQNIKLGLPYLREDSKILYLKYLDYIVSEIRLGVSLR